MFFKLCIFALLAAQVFSESRYFVGLFQAKYKWGYPIDLCVFNAILGGKYIKYTCSEDGTTVSENVYTSSDSTCSTTPTTTVYTQDDTQSNGLYAFNCDGTDDYFKSKIGTGCSSMTVVYGVVNACFKYASTNSSHDVYQQSQCNSTTGVISSYNTTTESCDIMLSSTVLASQLSATTQCGSFGQSGSIPVYAMLLDCVYDSSSNFPQKMNNSADLSNTGDQDMKFTIDIYAYAKSESMTDPEACSYDWFGWLTDYFVNSLVSITSTCDSNEGMGYSTIVINATVTVYENSNPMSEDCTTIKTAIMTDVEASSSNLGVNVRCSSNESAAGKVHMNYLIIFVFSCFAILYIF